MRTNDRKNRTQFRVCDCMDVLSGGAAVTARSLLVYRSRRGEIGRLAALRALARPQTARLCLPPFAQPVAEEVFQVGDGVDLLDRRLDVVLDPAEADGVVVEQDVAGPPVAVARLADRADVAQRLAAVELVLVVDLLGAVELVGFSVKTPGTCVWPWKQ